MAESSKLNSCLKIIIGLSLLLPAALSAQEPYAGALFDTSFQAGSSNAKYNGERKASLIKARFEENDIAGATAFVGVDVTEDEGDDDDDEGEIDSRGRRAVKLSEREKRAAGYFRKLRKALRGKDMVYFLNIAAISDEGSRAGLRLRDYNKAFNAVKATFPGNRRGRRAFRNAVRGVGEIEQYAWTDEDFHADDPAFLNFIDKFVVRRKFDLFMFHFPGGPGTTNPQKLAEIETDHVAALLSRYPDKKFIVHLFLPDFVELANTGGLDQLLTQHPNWLFSVDAGNVMGRWSNGNFMCPLMFCCGQDGLCSGNDIDPSPEAAAAFISEYDSSRDTAVQQALDIYKQYIEAYPDRFAWGSENGLLWHLDRDVFDRIIDFSRRFIAGLDPSVQDKFARENAIEFLQ